MLFYRPLTALCGFLSVYTSAACQEDLCCICHLPLTPCRLYATSILHGFTYALITAHGCCFSFRLRRPGKGLASLVAFAYYTIILNTFNALCIAFATLLHYSLFSTGPWRGLPPPLSNSSPCTQIPCVSSNCLSMLASPYELNVSSPSQLFNFIASLEGDAIRFLPYFSRLNAAAGFGDST